MEINFANVWERVADVVPERIALVNGRCRRTWREYDDRAARIAGFLQQQGLGHNSKIALHLFNSNEYLEAQFAAFKLRGSPINVNFRYVEDELVYLLDNADAEALFFHADFAPRISAIRERLPKLKVLVQVAGESDAPVLDEAWDYEQIISTTEPMQRISRPADDIYIFYTGGTTGMPKGVMFLVGESCERLLSGFAQFGYDIPGTVEETVETVQAMQADGCNPVFLAACPLMHATGNWGGAFMPHLMGGTVVTMPGRKFDPRELWNTVERERVNAVVIVGDAFARPMLDALDERKRAGSPYDLSSLSLIVSSGTMWSREVKMGLLEHHDMILLDNLGATEGGLARSITTRDNAAETGKFVVNETSRVFTEDDREVVPGSGEIGKLANGGVCPIGYYKDPEKSAETFREINGRRYSFPGDHATVEEDGSITLLGRGSNCINSMGEKIYPEEVEEAIKQIPAVYDCLVVGVEDSHYGQRVSAVVSLNPGHELTESQLQDFLHGKIAGYKRPRSVVFVDEVKRAPNGKADYQWAKHTATEWQTAKPSV